MIKAIFFDIGGVYVKWTYELVIHNISDKLKLDNDKIREIVDIYKHDFSTGKMTVKDFFYKISIKLCVDPETFRNVWYSPESLEKNKDVEDIIIKLKEQNFLIGAITDIDPVYLEKNKENGIYNIFDFVINSVDAKSRKIDKIIYIKAHLLQEEIIT